MWKQFGEWAGDTDIRVGKVDVNQEPSKNKSFLNYVILLNYSSSWSVYDCAVAYNFAVSGNYYCYCVHVYKHQIIC